MARLTSPEMATADPVEALKRRFLRQNRELAKTNSLQSIRIRCLEAEVSRLLTENLDLRDDILRLRTDLDLATAASARDAVSSVRDKLECKMRELGDLVAELGDLQDRMPSPRRAPRLPPLPPRRRRSDIDEATEEAMGRLPTIKEKKSWPRLSLGREENAGRRSSGLTINVDNSGHQGVEDSPDLGSPPVARFRDDDIPGSFDALGGNAVIQSEPETEAFLQEAMALNVETRRRRRESSGSSISSVVSKPQTKRSMVFDSPDSDGDAPKEDTRSSIPQIRAGAKRKMSAREEETGGPKDDGFAYTRKPSLALQHSSDAFSERKVPEQSKAPERTLEKSARAVTPSDRRALGEKPVNTDPVLSPKKPKRVSRVDKPVKPVRHTGPVEKEFVRPPSTSTTRERNLSREELKPTTTTKHSRTGSSSSLRRSAIPEPESKQTKPEEQPTLPPKTPLLTDILSPPVSQPSTDRVATTKDTPPPTDLPPTEPTGRAARRARATINYAEPSLVSKMRRPTKELMDAVGRDGRPLMGSIVRKEEEKADGGQWKANEAPSPLGSRSVSAGEQFDGRATLGSGTKGEPAAKLSSRASKLIAEFQSSSSSSSSTERPRSSTAGRREEVTAEEMSIFDFTDSSPSELKAASSAEGAKAQSGLRRHSAMLIERGATNAGGGKSGENGRSSRSAGTRRKSMMV